MTDSYTWLVPGNEDHTLSIDMYLTSEEWLVYDPALTGYTWLVPGNEDHTLGDIVLDKRIKIEDGRTVRLYVRFEPFVTDQYNSEIDDLGNKDLSVLTDSEFEELIGEDEVAVGLGFRLLRNGTIIEDQYTVNVQILDKDGEVIPGLQNQMTRPGNWANIDDLFIYIEVSEEEKLKLRMIEESKEDRDIPIVFEWSVKA